MINSSLLNDLFPLFEPTLLADMEKHAEIKDFAEGEDLIKSGQNIKSTILVKKGLVKVYREDEEGNEIFMYHLEPGQACALSIMCAVQNRTSEIKATAVRLTEVYAIPVQLVDRWMMQYKSWYQFVLSTYRSRFEELLNTIDAIAFNNMDERLVRYLRKHAEIFKSNTIPVKHAQIATELSTSREVISRLLKKLGERGLIKVNRQNIEILDVNKLPV